MVRRVLSYLVLAALAVAVVSYFAAPWVAFRALRAAAAAGDIQGMEKIVDYHAVRASLIPQIAENAPDTPAPKIWQDPIGAITRSIRAPQSVTEVERYLSPAAVAELSNAGPKAEGTPFRAGDLLPGLGSSEVRFWSPNRARIATVGGGKETLFTFERRGTFTWKLVHISLPAPLG